MSFSAFYHCICCSILATHCTNIHIPWGEDRKTRRLRAHTQKPEHSAAAPILLESPGRRRGGPLEEGGGQKGMNTRWRGVGVLGGGIQDGAKSSSVRARNIAFTSMDAWAHAFSPRMMPTEHFLYEYDRGRSTADGEGILRPLRSAVEELFCFVNWGRPRLGRYRHAEASITHNITNGSLTVDMIRFWDVRTIVGGYIQFRGLSRHAWPPQQISQS